MDQLLLHFVTWIAGVSVPTGIVIYLVKGLAKRVNASIDAYSSERAKLAAQFHNLDQLLQQTRALALTTENIKATISHEVWDRQMRWTALRDMYIRVLEVIGEQLDIERWLEHLELVRRKRPNDPRFPAEKERATVRSLEIHARVIRVASAAPLMVSAKAHEILIRISKDFQPINYDDVEFQKISTHNTLLLQGALNEMAVEARRHLDENRAS